MAEKQDVLYYAPSPPPQGLDPKLTQWLMREFDRIADNLREGRSQVVRLDVLKQAPPRFKAGLIGYFAADVVGATEGSYEYRSGAWHKL